jgi:phosphatidylglycerophosphate synthase
VGLEGEDEDDHSGEEVSIISLIIITEKSKVLRVWYFGYIVCCLLSSYFYVYVAAFQHNESENKYWWLEAELYFEGIFLISIILNFLTDYKDEDTGKVVRDISKIAMRYL